jgi:hypothetical protein
MIEKLPDKILRVEELTFILPNDFDGNVFDALEDFVTYMRNNKARYINDTESTIASLIGAENSRLCLKYGIFERVGDKYKPIDKSIENI